MCTLTVQCLQTIVLPLAISEQDGRSLVFQICHKTSNNRDKLLTYNTFEGILNGILDVQIVVHVI